MALPVLTNDKPMYEVVVPSTKQKHGFRPFLVKEQKSMLVAFESQDDQQVLTTMLNCIESCVPGIDVKKLATFDVDYIFTQIRAKSVGETSTVLTSCVKCEEKTEVKVNLQDIKIENTEVNSSVIPITDKIKIEMKYPTYHDVMRNPQYMENKDKKVEALFDSIVSCMHAVQTENENILIKDESREEIEKFVNSLNNQQLEKITMFVESMPTLQHEQKFTCEKCGHENSLELKGLQDFF